MDIELVRNIGIVLAVGGTIFSIVKNFVLEKNHVKHLDVKVTNIECGLDEVKMDVAKEIKDFKKEMYLLVNPMVTDMAVLTAKMDDIEKDMDELRRSR